MRRVLALFDAPVPAAAGLAALAAAGFDPADVACVPLLAASVDLAQQPLPAADDLAGLRQALNEHEVPPELLETGVELVRRGGILVLVEAPNRSADLAAALLATAGAVAPEDLTHAWHARPGTTYDWSQLPPPRLDGSPPARPDPPVADAHPTPPL